MSYQHRDGGLAITAEHGRQIAERIVRAQTSFVEALQRQGEVSREDAEHVFAVYRRYRLVKLDAVQGVYRVKHGGFLDQDVIRRAAAEPLPAGRKS